MTTRDFVGYGPNPPAVEWPDGARLAVSVVVNYEEGSEYSLLDGDAHVIDVVDAANGCVAHHNFPVRLRVPAAGGFH